MLLDCITCPGRGTACDGCVVAAFLDPTRAMDPETASAVALLRSKGLIGPVHLAVVPSSGDCPVGHGQQTAVA